MVTSWHTSKDRLYDKVVLRDDLTWTDGKPITAHDVEFSYRVIMSSAVPVPAMRSGTDQLRWVEVPLFTVPDGSVIVDAHGALVAHVSRGRLVLLADD